MTRRGVWLMLVTLLVLILAGWLGWWLSQNLIQRSEEVYTGMGEVAGRNPFYMAERLLTRLGQTVHSVSHLDELPDPPNPADTVLLAIPTYALSAAASQRLLDWVEQGGHLLIGVQHEYEPGQGLDQVLNRLRVRSHRTEPAPFTPIPVTVNTAALPLQVRFQSELRLNDARWLPLRWGRGRITLLTDLNLFDNHRLGDDDHAEFLWALLQPDPGSTIWLQYRPLTPSLVQLLWQYAWMPLLGLTLTLLAGLWHYSQRLGPVLVPRSSEPRRLLDHLHASSGFLWRHGAGPMLVHAARQYAQRHRAGTAPDAALLDASDQPLTERELVNLLQTLQRLDSPRHE